MTAAGRKPPTHFKTLIEFRHATVMGGKSSWFVQEMYHVAISHAPKAGWPVIMSSKQKL